MDVDDTVLVTSSSMDTGTHLLHAVARYPRTVCGLKLERGVHRTGPQWLDEHERRSDVVVCPDCREVSA
jgi:hypothetical protein